MMKRLARLLFPLVVGVASLTAPALSAEDATVSAVATFSILGDIVGEIGGDRVQLTTLVGPDGDTHVYEPRPSDIRAVAEADILFMNGLGLETWLGRTIEVAGFEGKLVVATDGLTPLPTDPATAIPAADGHIHGPIDPHAWQDVRNVRLYAENIAAGLIDIDPEGEPLYRENLSRYLAELDALQEEITSAIAALPPDRRTIVTSHQAFGYFSNAYGLTFLAPQGISTDAEPTAADVAQLIEQIRTIGAKAVFVENLANPMLIERIAEEGGAVIGDKVYSDSLSAPDGPAPTYIEMMRHNVQAFLSALVPAAISTR